MKNWAPIGQKILNLVLKKRSHFQIFLKDFFESDNCLILRLLIIIATQLSTKLLFAWNEFSFLDEQMNRYILRNTSINETSAPSISTDWSIQSISIKSDLPIFIDLSIDKSRYDFYQLTTPDTEYSGTYDSDEERQV